MSCYTHSKRLVLLFGVLGVGLSSDALERQGRDEAESVRRRLAEEEKPICTETRLAALRALRSSGTAAIYVAYQSAPTEVSAERRATIRRRCGCLYEAAGISPRFYVGLPVPWINDTKLQPRYFKKLQGGKATADSVRAADAIVAEAKRTGDVVPVFSWDTYTAKSGKVAALMRDGIAAGADFIVKADDDVCVAPRMLFHELANFASSKAPGEELYLGRYLFGGKERVSPRLREVPARPRAERRPQVRVDGGAGRHDGSVSLGPELRPLLGIGAVDLRPGPPPHDLLLRLRLVVRGREHGQVGPVRGAGPRRRGPQGEEQQDRLPSYAGGRPRPHVIYWPRFRSSESRFVSRPSRRRHRRRRSRPPRRRRRGGAGRGG